MWRNALRRGFNRPPEFEILPDDDLPMPELPEQEPRAGFSARKLLNVAAGLALVIAVIAASPLWLPTATNLWYRLVPGPNIYVQNNSTLEALATGDGHVVWQVQHISSLSPAYLYNGVIYAASASADAAIVAVRASDGHVLWRAETGNLDRAPDAVADHRVYFTRGQQLVALDAATGKIAWQAPTSDGSEVNGIQTLFGDGQVLSCENASGSSSQVTELHLIARAADTGKIRWQQALKNINDPNLGACLQWNNFLLLGDLASENDVSTFIIYDAQRGQLLWQKSIKGNDYVIDGDTLYIGELPATHLDAYNLSNGNQRWSIQLSLSSFVNLVSTAENGQYGTEQSNEVVIDTGSELDGVASATGRILWHQNEGGLLTGQPAVGPDGIIYAAVPNDKYIAAINSANGNMLWQTPFPASLLPQKTAISPTPFFWQNMLFIYDGEHLIAIDPNTGAVRWQTSSLPTLQPVLTTTDFQGQGQP